MAVMDRLRMYLTGLFHLEEQPARIQKVKSRKGISWKVELSLNVFINMFISYLIKKKEHFNNIFLMDNCAILLFLYIFSILKLAKTYIAKYLSLLFL